MKVAQVLLSPRIGGAESLVSLLASEWEKTGVESQVFYLDRDESGQTAVRRIVSLRRALKKYNPDVILGHSALPNLYSRLAGPRGVPVVTVLHSASDDFQELKWRVTEHIMRRRRTALVVAVGTVQASEYKQKFSGRVPLKVIPNGVETSTQARSAYEEVPSRIITVGRVATQKNPKLWLDVASRVEKSEKNLFMTWFGPASESEASQLLTDGVLGMSRGRYAGSTNQSAAEMVRSDILFHPANREAQSIVLLEAASLGIPIVCAKHIDEGMPFPLAAATFESGDADSAYEALQQVVSSYSEAVERAKALVPLVRETFSVTTTAARYAHAIEELTS